jgi:DNA-binding helix-hairpin-helix protein with protein kinase domain
MPIAKAIAEFRFAYGANAKSKQMQQPPGTLPLEAVSQSVAILFERAFSQEGARQSMRAKPQEWIAALEWLLKALKLCSRHSGHYYLNTLMDCPWCKIEGQSGIILFNVAAVGNSFQQSAFNISVVWSQIAQVQPPPALSALPDLFSLQVAPSPQAVSMSKEFHKGFGMVTSFLGLNTRRNQARQSALYRMQQAQNQWNSFCQRWQNEYNGSKFQKKWRELVSVKAQYIGLPELKQKKLQYLRDNQQQIQLHRFLDNHKIYHADIKGVGPGRKATLQSYGIETAADINTRNILAIPGFGPSLTNNLLRWRSMMERRFTFNPAKSIAPEDIAVIEREIQASRIKLERELMNGPAQLRQISQQIKIEREILLSTATQIMKAAAQAKADYEIL